jgi:hypothetical protein
MNTRIHPLRKAAGPLLATTPAALNPYDSKDLDWNPDSAGSTPSPTKNSIRISKSEYQKFLAFKANVPATSTVTATTVQTLTPVINVTIADPPKHGAWDDMHHLMSIFKDQHDQYLGRCAAGTGLSVWRCYTATQRRSIIEHLRSTPRGKALNRDEDFMAALPDARLYATLQHELGLSHDTQVERALTAVEVPGDVLDIPSWVTY